MDSMQPSIRQQELERLYNARRGHVPQISISDDNYHVTEALGSYYGDEGPPSPSSHTDFRDLRPLSFLPGPADSIETHQQQSQVQARRSRRNGSYFETKRKSPPRTPVTTARASETPSNPANEPLSPSSTKRVDVTGADFEGGVEGQQGQESKSPSLSRHSSTDTAVQPFPLNDIDYESSPAAVAQELSNLQAIRRMSMNVDNADPDLPSFSAGGIVPTLAPTRSGDENDTARLFWVPARLHPELAPKEFKTFIEDRVDKIRRRSGDMDTLSPDSPERSGSDGSLRRKKSMLSRQIDTKGSYEDGAERLERKRSKGMAVEAQTRVDLSELESLVNDPSQLVRRMSLDNARRSLDSGMDAHASEDMPILPPGGQSLKRSTRTTYRKGSLKRGERVPFSERVRQRQAEIDAEDSSSSKTAPQAADEPSLGLSRVQTEPLTEVHHTSVYRDEYPPRQSSRGRPSIDTESPRPTEEGGPSGATQPDLRHQRRQSTSSVDEERGSQSQPQRRQFQSRLASGPGRTTAQLPGYNNPNPLPQIIETLADGTKVPVGNLVPQTSERRASFDAQERKRSSDFARPFQRSGAHSRPIPGRDLQRSSTLDDLSSRPSLLPGSGGMGTDSLTFVPTYDDRKIERKESGRKSSWKWVFGSDDYDKKANRDDKGSDSSSLKSLRGSRLNKQPAEKARLDVLQTSIDNTNTQPRGRESLVLNREDIKLTEERRKESKKSSETRRDGPKESGLLSVIFGGKKKSGDSETKESRRTSKADRALSPDVAPRFLKPDIDYNWTRFSILEERAIYRMAHIKLANPRRALHSQVLLSNFMYSYLAKVQLMHPQVQIPTAHQKNQQRGGGQQNQEQQQQQQQQSQPSEYSTYQQWQEQQESENNNSRTNHMSSNTHDSRSSTDFDHEALVENGGYDGRSASDDYGYAVQPESTSSHGYHYPPSSERPSTSTNGGYSVAGTHDYLGYPKTGSPFESHGSLWDDEDDEDDDRTGGNGRSRGSDSLW